jgi:hypothetical protein
MLSYEILRPPFTLDFRNMSKDELRRYRDWFLATIPERVRQLERVVRGSPGFESWDADSSLGSLDALGEWYLAQVDRRPHTKDELERLRRQLPDWIDLPLDELTNRTFSLAFDVAAYFTQVLLHNIPDLRWEQNRRAKMSADYGQPVLVGAGPVPLNAVRIMITLAYGAKGHTGQRLGELYRIWATTLADT